MPSAINSLTVAFAEKSRKSLGGSLLFHTPVLQFRYFLLLPVLVELLL